jgi:hypothetical protein
MKWQGEQSPIYQLFKAIEKHTMTQTRLGNPDKVVKVAVQRLVLELLRRYDCDWGYANFRETVAGINAERGLVDPAHLKSALAEVILPQG